MKWTQISPTAPVAEATAWEALEETTSWDGDGDGGVKTAAQVQAWVSRGDEERLLQKLLREHEERIVEAVVYAIKEIALGQACQPPQTLPQQVPQAVPVTQHAPAPQEIGRPRLDDQAAGLPGVPVPPCEWPPGTSSLELVQSMDSLQDSLSAAQPMDSLQSVLWPSQPMDSMHSAMSLEESSRPQPPARPGVPGGRGGSKDSIASEEYRLMSPQMTTMGSVDRVSSLEDAPGHFEAATPENKFLIHSGTHDMPPFLPPTICSMPDPLWGPKDTAPAPPFKISAVETPEQFRLALEGISDHLTKRIDNVARVVQVIRDFQEKDVWGSEGLRSEGLASHVGSIKQTRMPSLGAVSHRLQPLKDRQDKLKSLQDGPSKEFGPKDAVKAQYSWAFQAQKIMSGRSGNTEADTESQVACTNTGLSITTDHSPWRSDWLRKVDYLSMVVIFLNTLWLGWEAEVRMQTAKRREGAPMWVRLVNVIFCILFIAELICKIALSGSDFWKKDRKWNFFDCLLVFSAIVDAFMDILNAGFMRILRILRAVRAARMMRLIGYVQHLRLMVASIATSFPTLVWACVLLALLLFLCALVLMIGVEAHIRVNPDDEVVLERFSSLGTTTITLFMAISGGVDWGECLEALNRVDSIYVPFFAIWVGFATFSVVGVLTAVIIQASSSILQVDKELVIERVMMEDKAKEGYLRELFIDMDISNHGHVTQAELNKALEKGETQALLKSLELDVSRTQNIFQFLDRDGGGLVSIDEFVEGLMKCCGTGMLVDSNDHLAEQIDNLEKMLQRKLPGPTRNGTRDML